ncbi:MULTISPECIES: LacI family DNA-binding transcriptional regulator [Caproicibacterium]|uniref:LacI family DNA-binding transcriptional regulator n=1 Tax=Caproicibacterium argilliputei TaxID=3030016 RepID=A0AA97D8G2_9FIRM|nr:LacI family DNA-binding transcriptional regulator [Caproicibacterium argilliputei]WOC32495.1 LacI family DNA-binding transcriptional regulator [Caproicibacterium argilliputei]
MANIKDVAKLAGLSVGTVSRVLNNRGYISDETRKKVHDAMRELNYVPNELAKSIFRQYTRTIGVMVPFVTHPYFGMIVQYLEYYASKMNYKIILCNSYFERDKELEYFRMLQGYKVDGIILCSRSMDIRNEIQEGPPIVSIDRILSDRIPYVSSDNYQGGSLATEHLIQKGCRKVAHICGSPSLHMTANQRSSAFEETCRKNGIESIVVSTNEDQFSSLSYYDNIQKLFQKHPDVDGIFASSDIIAAQVIQVAAKAGRHIPEDLKLVGFDDVNIAALTAPPLTTVHQPIKQLCKYAFELLLDEIKGEIVPMCTILPVSFVQRDST